MEESSSVLDDANAQFNFDRVRQELNSSRERIGELKLELMRLKFGWFECRKGCDILKEQLVRLTCRLEEELRVAGKYVAFQANKFRNDILNATFTKKIMKMNTWVKTLIGISVVIAGVTAVAFFGEMIVEATFLTVVRGALVFSLIGSAVALLLGFGIHFGMSWRKAVKNKQKMQEAIRMTNQALEEVADMQRQL